MGRIYVGDGNSYVWQWQPKEHIVLEGYPEGVFVHYANCDTKEATVVQSRMEGDKLIADIPPELMQESKDITVYVCDVDGTKHCHFLSVLSRPKPESYVTEPVEILRYETLQKRIPFDASYEGMLLQVVGGVAVPLKLGPGLSIRDGVLQINIATSGDAVSVNIDDDGVLHVFLDGVEVIPVVDDAGDLTWPGLDLVIGNAGDATLQAKEDR